MVWVGSSGTASEVSGDEYFVVMGSTNAVRLSYLDHLETAGRLESLLPDIETLGARMARSLDAGRTVFWMGNGGSAADSQHLAAEIVGRFVKERRGLPSVALTTDTSILTAVGNDYGFERIFSRQVEALCREGDIVVGLSTSGNSANVYHALAAARGLGAWTVGMTGADGGRLKETCDTLLPVPSTVTARIQECHILIGHLLCECIDDSL